MRRPPACRGFTLLELVMVMAIIGILVKAGTPVIIGSLKAYGTTTDLAVTSDRLRYASDRIAFEIRELTPGSITAMSATSFKFDRIDYAGTTTSRTVTIDQSAPSNGACNGTVRLSYNTPAMTPVAGYLPVLTDSMCSLAFAYYDQAGLTTLTPANVRQVEYTLAVKSNATGQTYSQRTRIALRNR
ncbi:type II secretion system GspH family protein|uniref:PilW family protein n=1 Tax=Noviherbaspirillum sp. L7-7A TaxID=2850560 RepID=UPI001C2BD387|nr:type II secretion system protein [Noviherbaspirillum sp. L7-7A]MBV0878144.1 type II secretion system GspH family protein [Noviherbaspirillum sp. L7-7A]